METEEASSVITKKCKVLGVRTLLEFDDGSVYAKNLETRLSMIDSLNESKEYKIKRNSCVAFISDDLKVLLKL